MATEKVPEVREPESRVDLHQKVRDIKVKGVPGTKVELMKVVRSSYSIICITSLYTLNLYFRILLLCDDYICMLCYLVCT